MEVQDIAAPQQNRHSLSHLAYCRCQHPDHIHGIVPEAKQG